MQESPELELQEVTLKRRLGRQDVLHKISATVKAGDRVGIVGASGSGKTTLLRLMNRLIDPTAGQIRWRGQPLPSYDAIALRRQLMLVPQEPKLLGMTVAQTLAYPLQLRRAAQIQERVQAWQQRMQIPDSWLSRQETELSLGQRQWVGLTRAFLCEPAVLLLDEPTSALDLGRISYLVEILASMTSTIVIASHQLDLLKKACHQVLWIEAGGLRTQQSINEVDWPTIQAALEAHNQDDSENWA